MTGEGELLLTVMRFDVITGEWSVTVSQPVTVRGPRDTENHPVWSSPAWSLVRPAARPPQTAERRLRLRLTAS